MLFTNSLYNMLSNIIWKLDIAVNICKLSIDSFFNVNSILNFISEFSYNLLSLLCFLHTFKVHLYTTPCYKYFFSRAQKFYFKLSIYQIEPQNFNLLRSSCSIKQEISNSASQWLRIEFPKFNQFSIVRKTIRSFVFYVLKILDGHPFRQIRLILRQHLCLIKSEYKLDS